MVVVEGLLNPSKKFLKIGWMELKNALQQIYIILNRAEYDFVSYEDLQLLKDILFNQEVLLKIKNL